MRRRIAIAAGGTAGHIYPALVTADTYRQAFPDIDLLFIGTPNGLESRLIPAYGYPLAMIRGAPLFRQGLGGKIRSLASFPAGTAQARRLLKAGEIRLVIGFGGYASAGIVLAARSLGLGTAIHEANIVPGLANKLLGRLVDRIYLTFDATARAFPKSRTLVTGNPIRPEIVSVREKKTRVSGPADSRARILVTGGSEGSDFLNRNAHELIGKLARHGFLPEALHQVGDFDSEPVRLAYSRAGIPATVVNYIENMAEAYAWADFAIACSGSQTVSELLICSLPSLLVPLSEAAGDHQIANAVAFADARGGIWVREEEWAVDALATRSARLLRQWREGTPDSGKLPIATDAARKIVADCETLMTGLW